VAVLVEVDRLEFLDALDAAADDHGRVLRGERGRGRAVA
jgi:hypothetical protein